MARRRGKRYRYQTNTQDMDWKEEQAAAFQNLPPLQELVLRVTIKAPRTRYLATPVVELAGVVSGLAAK